MRDPSGRRVALLAEIWNDKIVRDHPELDGWPTEVMATVERPDHTEQDPREERQRYYRRGVGPSRWLMVVVSFEQKRVITALAIRKDPRGWKP